MRHAALSARLVGGEHRTAPDDTLGRLKHPHAATVQLAEQALCAHAVHVIAAAAVEADVVEHVRLHEDLEVVHRVFPVRALGNALCEC